MTQNRIEYRCTCGTIHQVIYGGLEPCPCGGKMTIIFKGQTSYEKYEANRWRQVPIER